MMEGTKPIIMILEGTRPLTGPALPNLINAVSMFKIKNRPCFGFAEINKLANAEINKLTLTLTLTLTF